MVQRQGDIDPVARRGFAWSNKRPHHALRAGLGQTRRLWQAGCSRRVNEQTEIFAVLMLSVGAVWTRFGYACEGGGEVFAFLPAISPDFGVTFDQAISAADRFILVGAG